MILKKTQQSENATYGVREEICESYI